MCLNRCNISFAKSWVEDCLELNYKYGWLSNISAPILQLLCLLNLCEHNKSTTFLKCLSINYVLPLCEFISLADFWLFFLRQLTPLHEAAIKGDRLDMVEYFIGKGADINVKDYNGVSETILLTQQRVLYPSLYCAVLKFQPPRSEVYTSLPSKM